MIKAVDLFCDVGGLTHGLLKSGINVTCGIDIDPHSRFPYERNNQSHFIEKKVEDVTADEIESYLKDCEFTMLAGCAPCQPFSRYSQKNLSRGDRRWKLLLEFQRLIEDVKPDFITMENVPLLMNQSVFKSFLENLDRLKYKIWYGKVESQDYGVPQLRPRLVLLASRLGPISMIPPTTPAGKRRTVRNAIGHLPPITEGAICPKDRFHSAAELSELNYERIVHSYPGGSWKDWPERLIAKCHKNPKGSHYVSVYGRMKWDEPSPTLTTQFYGYGNGRFGHPEQHRAISLREGAILQSFPGDYKFCRDGDEIFRKYIGRLIGNSVPVKLAEAIGKSFLEHISEMNKK